MLHLIIAILLSTQSVDSSTWIGRHVILPFWGKKRRKKNISFWKGADSAGFNSEN